MTHQIPVATDTRELREQNRRLREENRELRYQRKALIDENVQIRLRLERLCQADPACREARAVADQYEEHHA